MKNLVWVILIVVALLLGWYVGRGEKPPAVDETVPGPEKGERSVSEKPAEWSEIVVHASYANGEVSFEPSALHDTAVVGPGDEIKWVLDCQGCPIVGSIHKIRTVRRVAKLSVLAETLIRVFLDPRGLENVELGDLGLGERDVGPIEEVMDTAIFDQEFPVTDFISTTIHPVIASSVEKGELWKYTYELCICTSSAGGKCVGDLECSQLDPHVWAHERKI